MKKIMTVVIVLFALVGLLFANQIIPSVGVRDVAAYPPQDTYTPAPPTPTHTPDPPIPTPIPTSKPPVPILDPGGTGDYLWPALFPPAGGWYAICPSCLNYAGGHQNLRLYLWYSIDMDYPPTQYNAIGYFYGYTVPTGYPVYIVLTAVDYDFFSGLSPQSCMGYHGVSGFIESWRPGDPFFTLAINPAPGKDAFKYCQRELPLILQQ